jgi:hypothetical protein
MMKSLATVLMGACLLLAGVPGSAAADHARSLLDRAKKAAGGEALDKIRGVHTRAKIKTGGLEGIAESWEDALTGTYRAEYALGPATGAQGFDGKTVWSLDSAKEPRKEEGDDAVQGNADDAYRRTMAYWYPGRWEAEVVSLGKREDGGRTFEVLRITPKGGRPFEMWLDAGTLLIDRTVEKGATRTQTNTFSDYREVHGVKVAYAQRSTEGEIKYDQFVTVESIEFNPALDAARFAMPAPPAPDFAFASGKTFTTVPFELLNNHVYVEVKLNGKGPYRLLCDTGGANIVTPELAHTLGLQSEGALQGAGVGEKSEDVGLAKVDAVEIGDLTLSNQVFAVFPMQSFSSVEGVETNGLVGYELFKRLVVKLDYENSRITLTLPSTFSYHGGGTVVPFRFNQHIPQVDGEIDGIPGKFDIDTGSRASLDLLAPFVEAHNLKAHYQPKFEAVTGWGVGGAARSAVTRARLLKLGSVEVREPVTELTLQKKGAFTNQYVAGNVGAGVLKRFNIIFDYPQQQLIFERNANDTRPDSFDRAGWWLNVASGAFEVVDVVAGGPAADAGLRVGDRVVAVDGKPTRDLSLPALRARLKSDAPGTQIHLRVQSGESVRETTLTLRDLV